MLSLPLALPVSEFSEARRSRNVTQFRSKHFDAQRARAQRRQAQTVASVGRGFNLDKPIKRVAAGAKVIAA
jgi:hypothetical protein